MKFKNFVLIPSSATTQAPIYGAVSGTMTGNITSQPISLDFYHGLAVQAVWTGTPTGTLKIQASNDAATWVDLPSPQALAGSAGNYMWNLFDIFYNRLQVVYLFTSGTGSLTVTVNGKSFGA